MRKRKRFSIEDLYPKDYFFDYAEFKKDPEGYQFTEADYAYTNAMELKRYEEEVPMTYYEKTLLRKWVIAGHNPRENPGSKYLCMTGSEPMDFLDVYRMDREIKQEMKGMNKAQRETYLKDLMGWTDPDGPEDSDFWDLPDGDTELF